MYELLGQCGIKRAREPKAGFLQLLADDRRVRLDLSRVDRRFCWVWKVARCAVLGAVFCLSALSNRERFVGPADGI
jgi:hypothetical protein